MVNFNDLPDDFIFNVLLLLEGGQLEVMKSVNRRIRRLANQPMFDDFKRIVREVRIQKRFIQKRSIPSGFLKVPDNRLTTTLQNYMVKSETKCLKIIDMVFSAHFLDEYVKMCRKTVDFHLVFDDSKFEESPEMYPDLYRSWWQASACPQILSVLYSMPSLTFINTELCQIARTFYIFEWSKQWNNGEQSKEKSLVVNNDEHCTYDNYFPSPNIVNILVLFKHFSDPYLTLPSDLIADFLVKATENTETEAKWIFSLSSFLSYDDKLAIRNNFEVNNLRGGESDGMDFKLVSHKHNKIFEGETKPYRGKYFRESPKFQMIEVNIYPKD